MIADLAVVSAATRRSSISFREWCDRYEINLKAVTSR